MRRKYDIQTAAAMGNYCIILRGFSMRAASGACVAVGTTLAYGSS